MSVKISDELEESITNNFSTNYWLYNLYIKINNDERWHHGDIYEEILFQSVKLDGISVNIILLVISNKYILLKIESDRLYDRVKEQITLYNNETLIDYSEDQQQLEFYNYIDSFRKINKILRTYKFDKYSGKFINPLNNCPCINHNALKRKALNFITKNNTNLYTNCDACSVCYEHTTHLTCCNHVVCLYCLDKIAENINVYDSNVSPLEQPILCPMCRNDLNNND